MRLRLSEHGSKATFWELPSRIHFSSADVHWSLIVWQDYFTFFAETRHRRGTKQSLT
jgi:hypothetical protein